jgi:hypothetical protein
MENKNNEIEEGYHTISIQIPEGTKYLSPGAYFSLELPPELAHLEKVIDTENLIKSYTIKDKNNNTSRTFTNIHHTNEVHH